jgi:hypothetical protein
MAFAENLADFISTADFAVAGTYAGSPVALIFDREYLETDLGQTGFSSATVRALLVTTAVPSAAAGDTVIIGSVTYKVSAVEVDPPDAGQGFTAVRLEKQ